MTIELEIASRIFAGLLAGQAKFDELDSLARLSLDAARKLIEISHPDDKGNLYELHKQVKKNIGESV